MTSRKMVSRSKPFFLNGDNMPLLLVLVASVLCTVVGGAFLIATQPGNPVVWVVLTVVTAWNAHSIRVMVLGLRAERNVAR